MQSKKKLINFRCRRIARQPVCGESIFGYQLNDYAANKCPYIIYLYIHIGAPFTVIICNYYIFNFLCTI